MSFFKPTTNRGMRTDLPVNDPYDRSRQDRYVAPPSKSKFWLILATVVTFVVLHVLSQLIRIWYLGFMSSQTPDFSRLWFKIIYGGCHNYLTLLITIGITVLVFALIFQLYSVQHSVDDNAKRMLEHDVDDSFVADPLQLSGNPEMTVVPDTKVHFDEDVSNLLSHIPLSNKGVKGLDGKVKFSKAFMLDIYKIARVPSVQQVWFDPASLPSNPNHDFGKHDYKTVLDLINKTWYVPDYETGEDPAGAYVVSTANENTIVATETRGGKGQKYIEPILTVWSRQKQQPNIIVTDLKMELLCMNVIAMSMRGYAVKSLNMLFAEKTDGINFIGYAVNAAIRGNITAMEEIISSISDIYFATTGGDNDVFNQAAASIFKRTVLGLIDYYKEECQELINNKSLSASTLFQRMDELWGRVTLYNSYLFVVETGSKQYDDPEITAITPEEIEVYQAWLDAGKPEGEYKPPVKMGIDLYFAATEMLPRNGLRGSISVSNKGLQRIVKSEKMLASAYGVALFNMIFFTDNKIIRLTSARPSENLDLVGFGFPRRMAIKIDPVYARLKRLSGARTRWTFYRDPLQKDRYEGSDYEYSGTIDNFGWSDCIIKGIFEKDTSYVKLELFDSTSDLFLQSFTFVFKKQYKRNYQGTAYIRNSVTGEYDVHGAIMHEYVNDHDDNGNPIVVPYQSVHIKNEISLILDDPDVKSHRVETPIIRGYDVHYAEKPTVLFLVAPPHLAAYNRLLLITIDQLYKQNVAAALSMGPGQRPFYVNKYLLDEVGNMQSNGLGISDLGSKMTSGLGQGQQFTLILQSMKQLESIKNYGADVAETLKGSAGKFFYMKAKDDSVIDFFMGLNGVKHVTQLTSQNTERPVDLFGNSLPTKRSISEQRSRDEQPVISKGKYLHLNETAADGRAIVSTGGDPILSEGSFVFPMSYRLHRNDIGNRNVPPTNLPSNSSSLDFDPQSNIPNFDEMIAKRSAQAKLAPKVMERFREAQNFTDVDIQKIPPEVYADDIMRGINENLRRKSTQLQVDKKARPLKSNTHSAPFSSQRDLNFDRQLDSLFESQTTKERHEYQTKALKRTQYTLRTIDDQKIADAQNAYLHRLSQRAHDNGQINDTIKGAMDNALDTIDEFRKIRYADGAISKLDLVQPVQDGLLSPTRSFDSIFAEVYGELLVDFRRDTQFSMQASPNGGAQSLFSADGSTLYIEDTNGQGLGVDRFAVQGDFYLYLASRTSWSDIADGRFEAEVSRMVQANTQSNA